MFVYMMNAPHKDVPARPSKFYLDGILEGCKDNQIPTESVMEAVKRTRQEVKKEKIDMQDKTYRRGNIFCGILLKKSIYNRKEKHMKVRKLKTRIAAFGLAVLMGISTLSSANAFAAEQTGSEQQTEVQASEQAVTSQKDTSVTADDITKAVSDDTFAVETSMEGIHYDAEKEDVTLVSIKDENGGAYHSDKAGTYIATYMVIPKDKSDSYTITRKVTLTDTEGQAHSEENGGEKQKSDTESEDDSESPVQNYTDVEIETSEEDASAQAVKELKEDIEEGNVMVLSAAERATSSGSTVTLTKGRTIYYPSYIGNYLTCLFTVNGKIAYCLQSQKHPHRVEVMWHRYWTVTRICRKSFIMAMVGQEI